MKKKEVFKVLPIEQNHEFYFRVAVKYAMKRDFITALKYIDKAIALDVFNPDYLFNKACILVELKETKESIKILNNIIWKIDPTYSECYFGLGCNYFEMDDYQKSLANFEKYVLLEEEGEFFEDAYELLLYMQFTAGGEFDLGRRLAARNREQNKEKKNSIKLHNDASTLLFSGKYQEAIKKFERSIMAYPDTTGPRIRISMAYFMTGQLNLAMLLARSALKIQRSNYMARLCLALYYSIDGKHDLSEKMLILLEKTRRRRFGEQEIEDRQFYEQMILKAPVEESLKNKLTRILHKNELSKAESEKNDK